MQRKFIHLPPFERYWLEISLGDDDLRLLQLYLLLHPDAGDVVPGTHGIRKVRWSIEGKGKRSGIRVFYVDFPEYGLIYLITALKKSEASDLKRTEQQMLGALVLELGRILKKRKEDKNGKD